MSTTPAAERASRVVVRELDETESAYWDENVQTFPHAHPLNAFDWATVRAVDGWTAVHLVAERDGQVCGALLILSTKLPFLPLEVLCGPHGPVCRPGDDEAVRALHAKVLDLAQKRRALFLRVDPNFLENEASAFERTAASLGYIHLPNRWTFWNSPRDEYRIDLSKASSADELHDALDRDTRRCIRKAARDGLQIEVGASEDDLKAFYDVFSNFSVSKGFMARGYQYQRRLWDCYIARGRGRLFLAKYDGKVVGGLICILFGRKCIAMHMGSLYEYQKLQSYYAYVWESIRWAKEHDCEWYSFRGVGTTPTQEAFKRKFNPEVVALAGYFDYPFMPLAYKLFSWLEFVAFPALYPALMRTRKAASSVAQFFNRATAKE